MRARATANPAPQPVPEPPASAAAIRLTHRVSALVCVLATVLLPAVPDPDAALVWLVLFSLAVPAYAATVLYRRLGLDQDTGQAIGCAAAPLTFLLMGAVAGLDGLLDILFNGLPPATAVAAATAATAVVLTLLSFRKPRRPDTPPPERSPDTLRRLYPYIPPRGGRPAVLWPETPYLVLLQHATDQVAEAARTLTGTRVPAQAVALMREQEWRILVGVHERRIGGAADATPPAPEADPDWLDRVSTLIHLGALADEAAHDPDAFATTYLDEVVGLRRALRHDRQPPHSGAPLGRPPAPVALAPEHEDRGTTATRSGHG